MRRLPESDHAERCRVELEEGRSYYTTSGDTTLCGCKRTRNPPFCDESLAPPAAPGA